MINSMQAADVRRLSTAEKKSVKTHWNCSCPRKSLVKGERFIRVLNWSQSDKQRLPRLFLWALSCYRLWTSPKGRRADSGGTAIPDRLLTSRTINCLNCTSVDKKSFDHGKDAWSFSKRSNFEEQILHLILAQWAEKRWLFGIRFFNEQAKTLKGLWRPLATVI